MKTLQVRLSDEEHYRIKSMALTQRKTVTDLVRERLLAPVKTAIDTIGPENIKFPVPIPSVSSTRGLPEIESQITQGSKGIYRGVKMCKNGHIILGDRDRCQTKGCKYA